MKKVNKTGRSILGRMFLPMGILLMMLASPDAFAQKNKDDGKWGWVRLDNPGYYYDGSRWGRWSEWQTTNCFKGIDFRVSRTKKKDHDGDYKWR